MSNTKGFLNGILSSATFGLIPLFTLPLLAEGMFTESILFYRFFFASVILGVMLKIKGTSFRVSRSEFLALVGLSFLYVVGALFLFTGYQYMPTGIATTIHFIYPVLVTVIMTLMFHERRSMIIVAAVILAVTGVAMLSYGDGTNSVNIFGILIVFTSALGYALYVIFVNKSKVRAMNGQKITFYVMSIGTLMFFVNVQFKGGLQSIPDNLSSWSNVLMLAIIPTVISNIALVRAVKHIGSTMTAILGAMEPLTAVCVGVLVFGEPFSASLMSGILFIITAVSLVVLAKPINGSIRHMRYIFVVTKRRAHR